MKMLWLWLKVVWDKPEWAEQKVKRVSPWLVILVSVPADHLSGFYDLLKKVHNRYQQIRHPFDGTKSSKGKLAAGRRPSFKNNTAMNNHGPL